MNVSETIAANTGFSTGSVIFQNRSHIPAPSIVLASYRSLEIVCKPAKRKIAAFDISPHTPATMTAGMTYSKLDNQFIGALIKPAPLNTIFTAPVFGSYICLQRIPRMIGGVAQGINIRTV